MGKGIAKTIGGPTVITGAEFLFRHYYRRFHALF